MRFVEWYLGLPPPHAGQGTDWGLSGEWPWAAEFPHWAIVLLLTLVAVGVVSVYRRDARLLGWPARCGLILLRLASVTLLLVMLAQIGLTATRTGMPTLAVLIDTSASMGLEDRYTDEVAANAARQLAHTGGSETVSRLKLAQSLLLQDEGRFLRQLLDTHQVRLFRFDSAATAVDISSADAGEQLARLMSEVAALQPTGSQTRPAMAVGQVLDDLRGSPPTALIILTDGIPSTSDDDALPGATPQARDRSVPILPIGIGSADPARDVQLLDVLADDVVFADDPITFSFQLKGFGYEGRTVQLTLRGQGDPGVLQSLDVTIGADGEAVPVELTHIPTEAGEFDFVIEAPSLSGETNADNNRATHRLQVRREQLRVLLVERLPRWEFRHLKPLLERDPAVELRTVLQQADVAFADEDRTALPRFPVARDELLQFDVIIWGDVDLAYLNPGALDHLHEFVAERGGGLVMIAGEQHNPLSYGDTPLEDLLPVELGGLTDEVSLMPGVTPAGFRPELTVEGRTRAALRLGDSSEQNDQIWRQLPPLYWLFPSGRRKPAAQVLAVHPTRHGPGGQLPVIVAQRFGSGQVLFHASDELWQWRQRVEDRYYGRYWLQMIRYLSRSKLRSDARGVELTSDRSVYQQGEAVELRARFLDPLSLPTADNGATAVIEGPGGRRESLTLTRMREAPNLFTGRAPRLSAGSYHAWLAEPAVALVDPENEKGVATAPSVASTDFRVEVSANELRDRRFRRADLVEAASQSRGSYYPFWEAERLLDEIPRGRAVPVSSEMLIPIWNRGELLLLLGLLLASEWIIRKRVGLV